MNATVHFLESKPNALDRVARHALRLPALAMLVLTASILLTGDVGQSDTNFTKAVAAITLAVLFAVAGLSKAREWWKREAMWGMMLDDRMRAPYLVRSLLDGVSLLVVAFNVYLLGAAFLLAYDLFV